MPNLPRDESLGLRFVERHSSVSLAGRVPPLILAPSSICKIVVSSLPYFQQTPISEKVSPTNLNLKKLPRLLEQDDTRLQDLAPLSTEYSTNTLNWKHWIPETGE